MKNCLFALLILSCSVSCLARTPKIRSGATVYIEPMGGYETYLAAAFTKKHVPLTVVADKDKAAYIITSTVPLEDLIGGHPGVAVDDSNGAGASGNGNGASPSNTSFNAGAGIAVIDASQIVFAYSSGSVDTNRVQTTAEDCAKHLKQFIEKQRK